MNQLIELEIENESNQVLTESKKYLVIKTPENYSRAAEFLKVIGDLQDVIKKFFAPMVEKTTESKRAAAAAKKSIDDEFAKYHDPLEIKRDQIKYARRTYIDEQDRITKAKRDKAEAEARAEEDAKRKKLETDAKKAEKKGDTDKAEELREQAENVFVPAKEIESNVPKIAGIKTPAYWKAEILDYNRIPREQLYATEKQKEAHRSHLNAIARSMKDTLKIEGVRFYEEKGIRS